MSNVQSTLTGRSTACQIVTSAIKRIESIEVNFFLLNLRILIYCRVTCQRGLSYCFGYESVTDRCFWGMLH